MSQVKAFQDEKYVGFMAHGYVLVKFQNKPGATFKEFWFNNPEAPMTPGIKKELDKRIAEYRRNQ